MALLVISPASSPALPSGFFRAFCKPLSWVPAFWREAERNRRHLILNLLVKLVNRSVVNYQQDLMMLF